MTTRIVAVEMIAEYPPGRDAVCWYRAKRRLACLDRERSGGGNCYGALCVPIGSSKLAGPPGLIGRFDTRSGGTLQELDTGLVGSRPARRKVGTSKPTQDRDQERGGVGASNR